MILTTSDDASDVCCWSIEYSFDDGDEVPILRIRTNVGDGCNSGRLVVSMKAAGRRERG